MRTGAILLLGAVLLAACGGPRDEGAGAAPAALVVLPPGVPFPGGGAVFARAEVAATPEARERGLMFRDVLPPDTGMLFAYPEERPLSFWMKNCRRPLSAAFMDRSGRVLNVVEMAPAPEGVPDAELPRYGSDGPAVFVLEMEEGWFARKGIRPGDRAELGPALTGVVPR